MTKEQMTALAWFLFVGVIWAVGCGFPWIHTVMATLFLFIVGMFPLWITTGDRDREPKDD